MLATSFLFSGPVLAQALPQAGKVYESISYDLDGDGKLEKISLVAYNVDLSEESFWGRLQVTNAAGKMVWQAPAPTDSEQAFAFGMWAYGACGLGWLGDADGDGKAELLSPGPVSDVSPANFRRYRWMGKGFQALSRKMLLEIPAGSGRFVWRDPIAWDGTSQLTWVMALSGSPKQIVAEVMSYRKDGQVWLGDAVMKGDGLGMTVTGWKKALGPSR